MAVYPVATVEISFEDPVAPPTWVDVTSYVYGFQTSRGRQRLLDRAEPGSVSLVLNNVDRRFEPDYASSPYYPNVLPMRRVKITAVWNSTTYNVYFGFIESWDPVWPGGMDEQANLRGYDGLKILSLAKITNDYPQQLSSDRVIAVLNDAGYTLGQDWIMDLSILDTNTYLGPNSSQVIGTGQSEVQAASLSQIVAMDHLAEVEFNEQGQFFVDNQGRAVFRDRATLVKAPYNTSQATFGNSTGEIPILDAVPRFDDADILNDIVLQRTGGTVQETSDATSQNSYRLRDYSKTDLIVTTDAEVLALAQSLLAQYKDPAKRLESILLEPTLDPTNVNPQLLGRELGDRITVNIHPQGSATAYGGDYLIEGIAHAVTEDSWQTTFRLARAPSAAVWILDTGLLDSTTTLTY